MYYMPANAKVYTISGKFLLQWKMKLNSSVCVRDYKNSTWNSVPNACNCIAMDEYWCRLISSLITGRWNWVTPKRIYRAPWFNLWPPIPSQRQLAVRQWHSRKFCRRIPKLLVTTWKVTAVNYTWCVCLKSSVNGTRKQTKQKIQTN
jgi:hypothetical protein